MTYIIALIRCLGMDYHCIFKIDRGTWIEWTGGFTLKNEILIRAFLNWAGEGSPSHLVDFHIVSEDFVEKYEHLYNIIEPPEDLL